MEVIEKIQREYNPAHPNYKRWQKAREISDHRAEFVLYLLSKVLKVEGLRILDIGAGEGSTSKLLSQKNYVVSLEPKTERIKKIQPGNSLYPLMADCKNFPLKDSSFDLIILQDVIEHLELTKSLVDSLNKLLSESGMIYISTPNKSSIFNIMSDPHWGIPFLCLFNREQIKKYFLKFFRKNDFNRKDIAQLFSLKELINYFEVDFSVQLHTKSSVDYLLNGGKGIVWSKFHLTLVRLVNTFGLSRIIRKISNDGIGFINKFFVPTFYLILKKKKKTAFEITLLKN